MPHSAVLVLSLWWNGKCWNGGVKRRLAEPQTVNSWNRTEALWTFGGVLSSLAANQRQGLSTHGEQSSWYYSTFCCSTGARGSSGDHCVMFRNSFMKCEHICVMHVLSVRWCVLREYAAMLLSALTDASRCFCLAAPTVDLYYLLPQSFETTSKCSSIDHLWPG